MHRYIHPSAPKSDEILDAEQSAANAIDTYFASGYGHQAMVHRATGIPAPVLTRMSKGRYPVSLEMAMLMEMASNGELRAEQIAPAYADLLAEYMAYRATPKKKS